MADNLTVKDASGGTQTILMDEMTIDAVTGKVQRIKPVVGTGDVSTGNPMPVNGTVAVSSVGGTTVVSTTQLPSGVGQAAMAASLPVVLASNQSAVPVSGTVGVSGTVPVSATQLPSALGQAAMAASLPVVIANNQSAVPVSGTVAVSSVGGTVAVSNATLGATTDAAVDGDSDGSLSAKLRGLLKSLGAIGDAAASGAASIQAKLRYLTTNLGAQSDAQVYGVGDGSIFAKLKGIAGGIGALDVASSGGATDGSVIAKLKALNVTLEALLPAATGEVLVYNSSKASANGVLYRTTNVASGAAAAATTNFAAANFASGGVKYFFVPMLNWRRLTVSFKSTFNNPVEIIPYAILNDGTDQVIVPLDSAFSLTSGNSLMYATAGGGSGAAAYLKTLPVMDKGVTHIVFSVEPTITPVGGTDLLMLVHRDKQ